MKRDIFEFDLNSMTFFDLLWRIVFLSCILAVVLFDLLVLRPS